MREQQILLPRPKPGPGQPDRCLLAAGGEQPRALALNCLGRHLLQEHKSLCSGSSGFPCL